MGGLETAFEALSELLNPLPFFLSMSFIFLRESSCHLYFPTSMQINRASQAHILRSRVWAQGWEPRASVGVPQPQPQVRGPRARAPGFGSADLRSRVRGGGAGSFPEPDRNPAPRRRCESRCPGLSSGGTSFAEAGQGQSPVSLAAARSLHPCPFQPRGPSPRRVLTGLG